MIQMQTMVDVADNTGAKLAQVITVYKGSTSRHGKKRLKTAKGRGLPEWLELNAEAFSGIVKAMPKRADIAMDIQEQLIVELYSK